jgi:CRP/FNR family transcriptional regulator, cyclic AMP receptor protein
VEQAGMVRRFPRGDALFHQGDDPGMVLIIHSGRIKVSVVTPDGHDVMLGYLQPGTVLGDLAALDGEPRSTTAIAIDAVEALGVPMLAFRRLLDERPGIMRALALIAAQRLRLADRQRVEFAAYDVLGRVARRIDELAESGTETAEGIEIDAGLSQEDLAAWTAASREAVSKALGAMRTLGWIETRRRVIVVLDRGALRRHAGL